MGRLATPQRLSQRRHYEGNSLMRTIIKRGEKSFVCALTFFRGCSHYIYPTLARTSESSLFLHKHHNTQTGNKYLLRLWACLSLRVFCTHFFELGSQTLLFYIVCCCFVNGIAGRGRKEVLASSRTREAAKYENAKQSRFPHQIHAQKTSLTTIMIHDLYFLKNKKTYTSNMEFLHLSAEPE